MDIPHNYAELVVPEKMETLQQLDDLEQEIMAKVQPGAQIPEALFEQIKFISMLRRANDFGVFLGLMGGMKLPQLIKLVDALEGIRKARDAMRADPQIRSIFALAVLMPPRPIEQSFLHQ